MKKLVNLVIANGNIDKDVAKYVLEELSKKELKVFLKLLKNKIYANQVNVTSSTILLESERIKIKKIFVDKDVEFTVNKEIGGGISAIVGDTIIDLSFKSYISRILQNLS